MSWVRIDDRFADHTKILGLTDKEFRIHVNALCYAGIFQCDKVHDIPSERYPDVVFAYHCVGGLQEAEADRVIRQLSSRPR